MGRSAVMMVLALTLAACGTRDEEAPMAIDDSYLQELATEADEIAALAASDAAAARTRALDLNGRMCAFVAGLEAAGTQPEAIQAAIDPVGERLGSAFALMAPPE